VGRDRLATRPVALARIAWANGSACELMTDPDSGALHRAPIDGLRLDAAEVSVCATRG